MLIIHIQMRGVLNQFTEVLLTYYTRKRLYIHLNGEGPTRAGLEGQKELNDVLTSEEKQRCDCLRHLHSFWYDWPFWALTVLKMFRQRLWTTQATKITPSQKQGATILWATTSWKAKKEWWLSYILSRTYKGRDPWKIESPHFPALLSLFFNVEIYFIYHKIHSFKVCSSAGFF